MNTSDIRYIKTEKNLMESYLELKSSSSNAVKLCDLCRKAMINKTTFYKHYESMEQFHAYVCKTVVKEKLCACEHICDAFSNTEGFVSGIIDIFTNHQKFFMRLFSSDSHALINTVEEVLLDIYLKDSDLPKKQIQIRFAIGGATRVLLYANSKQTISATVRLLGKVLG